MAIKASVEGLSILDPTTKPEPVQTTMASRPETMDGKVVCLLSNGKLNADRIMDLVTEEIAKRYKLGGVVRMRKPSISKPAPGDMLDEIAGKCHFAITAVGD